MNDLAFGLEITLWGMGLVFALLTLLWALLALAGWVEGRAARAGAAAPPAAAPGDDTALVAELLAAP
ncbi:MAG: sodium pump decarboxylase subunit gamma, partial [Chloroflexales bacterium]|nr:sodium pump decarboxylase subunit gamma [Chloroflexales bacterium]